MDKCGDGKKGKKSERSFENHLLRDWLKGSQEQQLKNSQHGASAGGENKKKIRLNCLANVSDGVTRACFAPRFALCSARARKKK